MYLIDVLKYITWCNCLWCWLSLHTCAYFNCKVQICIHTLFALRMCVVCSWCGRRKSIVRWENKKMEKHSLCSQSARWCVLPKMLRDTSALSESPLVGSFALPVTPRLSLYASFLSHSILFPFICSALLCTVDLWLPFHFVAWSCRDCSGSIRVHPLTQHFHSCQRDHLMSVCPCD